MGDITLAVTAAVLAWEPRRQNDAQKTLCLSIGLAQLPVTPPFFHHLLHSHWQARALPRRRRHAEVPASVCHPLVFSSGMSSSADIPLWGKIGR